MSRDGSFEAQFADDDFVFRLAWGELIKLQEARDCGPLVILERLGNGHWRVEDIREVVRLGLIGGGLDPGKALKLVRLYVEQRPPFENLALAQRILGSSLVGVSDEELEHTPGKAEAPSGSTPSSEASSVSEPSTPPA
jgi:hypothetical protein